MQPGSQPPSFSNRAHRHRHLRRWFAALPTSTIVHVAGARASLQVGGYPRKTRTPTSSRRIRENRRGISASRPYMPTCQKLPRSFRAGRFKAMPLLNTRHPHIEIDGCSF